MTHSGRHSDDVFHDSSDYHVTGSGFADQLHHFFNPRLRNIKFSKLFHRHRSHSDAPTDHSPHEEVPSEHFRAKSLESSNVVLSPHYPLLSHSSCKKERINTIKEDDVDEENPSIEATSIDPRVPCSGHGRTPAVQVPRYSTSSSSSKAEHDAIPNECHSVSCQKDNKSSSHECQEDDSSRGDSTLVSTPCHVSHHQHKQQQNDSHARVSPTSGHSHVHRNIAIPTSLSIKHRIRSVSHGESDIICSLVSTGPPKQPNKLPSCSPDSGMTFIDGKFKLAKFSRMRSSSMSESVKTKAVSPSKKGHSTINENNICHSLGDQLRFTIQESSKYRGFSQALENEDRFGVAGNFHHHSSNSRTMSRITETGRFIMVSRTPCLDGCHGDEDSVTQVKEPLDMFSVIFQHASVYDALAESGKLVVLFSNIPVAKAHRALRENSVTSAAIWNPEKTSYDGLLTTRHLFLMCQHYSNLVDKDPENDKLKPITFWMDLIQNELRATAIIEPDLHLHDAVHLMKSHCSRYLSVMDNLHGNLLAILDISHVLRFLWTKGIEGSKLRSTWMQQTLINVHGLPMLTASKCGASCTLKRGTSIRQVFRDSAADIYGDHCRKTFLFPIFGEDNTLEDVVTEADCVNFLLSRSDWERDYTIQECCSYNLKLKKPVIRCRTNETVMDLMQKFFLFETDYIVLVDNNNELSGRCLGIVPVEDFFWWLIEGHPQLSK